MVDEEDSINFWAATQGIRSVSIFADTTKMKNSFNGVPRVDVNKCPWCGGLDGIEGGRCNMPGCGRPVIYLGPKPVDEPALSDEEIEMLARAKEERLKRVAEMGELPGNIREMRREVRRRQEIVDQEMTPAQKPGPRPRRAPPVAMPEDTKGPGNPHGDF